MLAPLTTIWSLLVLSASFAHGSIRLVTMDDDDPVIRYSPFGWVRGEFCTSCFQNVDVDQVYGGTWMNATQDLIRGVTPPVFLEFNFTGLSVSITGIYQYLLAGTGQKHPRPTSFNVTLDGNLDYVGNLEYEVDYEDGEVTDYRAPLYENNWDQSGTHTIRLELDGQDDPFQTLVLDSIEYEMDLPDGQFPITSGSSSSPPSTSTSGLNNSDSNNGKTSSVSSRIGALVGATLGGCILLLGVATVVWCSLRKRKVVPPSPEDVEHPYIPPARDSTRTKSLLILEMNQNLPERGSGQQHVLGSAGPANLSGQHLIVDGSPLTIISTASTLSVPPEYASAADAPIRHEKH